MEHKLLIGNIVLYPKVIKNFLKKSCYWISFDEKENTLKLCANHGGGGETLLFISNCSYIQAKEFAELLGLGGDSEKVWSKSNPIYGLDDDGSEDAEKIKICAFKLGIPLTVYNVSKNEGWAFHDSAGRFTKGKSMWPVEKILQELKECAERNKENISTTP